MDTIYLIIDESGAKGYSDKPESYAGEVGVMAGYLIPEAYFDDVRNKFESLKEGYFSEGKVHIAELKPEDQSRIREDIYGFLIEKNIVCVFEAIHSQGFYENYERLERLIENNKSSQRSSVTVPKRKSKELLHEHLFQGVFGKAVAFCIDNFGYEFELKVITDKVDESIKKCFLKAADELINVGEEKKTIVSGFDTSTREVVKGSLVSKIDNVKDVLDDYSKIKYSISYEDTGLTLAADVIVNGLNYHFKSRSSIEVGINLNDQAAVINHPLEQNIYGLWDSSASNYFADAVFMHPKTNKVRS